ncbi:MAG TPA: hypothetical protein VGQ09_20355 [Chitinophagaceae bacterium]|jgi:hypothetical protein|nr:hypothetical protein [Chitinophagaceae bacterium]
MKEKLIVLISAGGLLLGCILGMTGSIIPSATFRSVAWATGSAGIILAGALLTMYYFRKGYDIVAAGFLILSIAESVVFSSCATNADDNIPSFGAGVFLWALSIAVLSLQKIFPLFVRCTGTIAAVLFAILSIRIFTGHPLNALAKPLPFYAYPFYAATLIGWVWTLLRTNSFSQAEQRETQNAHTIC